MLPDDPANPTGFESWRASLQKVLRTRAPDTMPIVKYSVRRPEPEGGGFVDKYWRPANFPVLSSDGEVQYIIHRTEDISDRYLAEAALRESERRFHSLANSIPQLAWLANQDGWVFWYNDRWYDYTGTTFEEMQGWGWEKVHHPDYRASVVAFVTEAWKKSDPFELSEARPASIGGS